MKGWNLFQLMHRKARGDDVGNDKFGKETTVPNPTVTLPTS